MCPTCTPRNPWCASHNIPCRKKIAPQDPKNKNIKMCRESSRARQKSISLFSATKTEHHTSNLDNSNFVRNIQSIIICRKFNVSFFLSIWTNQSITFLYLYIVLIFNCLLNLMFRGMNINYKYKRVLIFNFFHRVFGRQWIFDQFQCVFYGSLRHRFSCVFWCSGLRLTHCFEKVHCPPQSALFLNSRSQCRGSALCFILGALFWHLGF